MTRLDRHRRGAEGFRGGGWRAGMSRSAGLGSLTWNGGTGSARLARRPSEKVD